MAEFPDIPDFLDRARPAACSRLDAKPPGLAPPTRAEVQKRRRSAVVVSGGWLAVQLAIFGLRRDLGELPAYYVVTTIVGPCAAGLLIVAASVHPGRLGLGLRAPLILALALLGPAAFIVAALLTAPLGEGSHRAGILADSSCLNAIVAWALLPMVAAALVLRRTFASAASSRSALLGGGIGLIAGALFAIHCPITDRLHVALAHGGAVGLVALAGGLLLARSTRI